MELEELDDEHREKTARHIAGGDPVRVAALLRSGLLDVAIAGIGGFGEARPGRYTDRKGRG